MTYHTSWPQVAQWYRRCFPDDATAEPDKFQTAYWNSWCDNFGILLIKNGQHDIVFEIRDKAKFDHRYALGNGAGYGRFAVRIITRFPKRSLSMPETRSTQSDASPSVSTTYFQPISAFETMLQDVAMRHKALWIGVG